MRMHLILSVAVCGKQLSEEVGFVQDAPLVLDVGGKMLGREADGIGAWTFPLSIIHTTLHPSRSMLLLRSVPCRGGYGRNPPGIQPCSGR